MVAILKLKQACYSKGSSYILIRAIAILFLSITLTWLINSSSESSKSVIWAEEPSEKMEANDDFLDRGRECGADTKPLSDECLKNLKII